MDLVDEFGRNWKKGGGRERSREREESFVSRGFLERGRAEKMREKIVVWHIYNP